MIDMSHSSPLISSLALYEDLPCYKKAMVVHDLVCHFCGVNIIPDYINSKVMIKMARMCELSIVEGCLALATSPEAGLALLKSAQGNLVELRNRLTSYIASRYKGLWMPDSAKYQKMWEMGEESDDVQRFIFFLSRNDSDIGANMLIVLVDQADTMLYSIIQSLARELYADGTSE